jgi:3-methyladenine DNA glycosylase/8-oxoguanine DNA glycosylase
MTSAADARGLVEIDGPYDLAATLRRNAVWGVDPTLRISGDEAWTAFRTPSGPASVHYVARGSHVEVEAWGAGAAEAVASAPDHLGANDPSWRFETDHPIVGKLVPSFRGLRFGRSRRIFERLVPVVIAQKVTSAGASQSWKELVWRLGERAPGPAKLWIPPSAERLRALPYYELHPMGLERRRAETILFAARRARRLESFAALDPAEAYARLLAFPGIGAWTAALITSAAHGDADAVPVGDYHMPHHVTFAFTGERRGSDERMLELLEPFRPQRGRVLALLMRGIEGPPRRGPRLSVRDIRRM